MFVSKITPSEDVTVLIGIHDLNVFDEIGTYNQTIDDIVLHPDWDDNSGWYNGDLAIITLTDSVTFSNTIHHVCLPLQSSGAISENGLIVGWGLNKDVHNHDQKSNEIVVKSVNNSYCYEHFPDSRYSLKKSLEIGNMLCVHDAQKSRGSCRGDDGGGFYVQSYSSWIVQGIMSVSNLRDLGCEDKKLTFLTKTEPYTAWIVNEMAKTMDKNPDGRTVIFNCKKEEG